MGGWTKGRKGWGVSLPLGIGIAVLSAFGGSARAEISEIDAFQRAVNTQSKVDALAFIDGFGSSHLVPDLIELLRPDVATQVCAALRRQSPQLRAACGDARAQALPAAAAAAPPAPTAVATVSAAPSARAEQPAEAAPNQAVPAAPAGTALAEADADGIAPARDEEDGAARTAMPPPTQAAPAEQPTTAMAAAPVVSRPVEPAVPVAPAPEAAMAEDSAAPSWPAFVMLPKPTFAIAEEPSPVPPTFLQASTGPIRSAEDTVSVASKPDETQAVRRDR
jgi:hypothetical protein